MDRSKTTTVQERAAASAPSARPVSPAPAIPMPAIPAIPALVASMPAAPATAALALADPAAVDSARVSPASISPASINPAAATPAPVDPAPVNPAVVELVARCDAELVAAQLAMDPADRFLHAHLGALRLAGALLAAAGARPPRGRPRSAWDRLTAAVPDCASWAAFFTSGARIRAALDAGIDSVDDAFATTWVEAAEDFRDEVCRRAGIDPFADLRSALSARSTMAWAS